MLIQNKIPLSKISLLQRLALVGQNGIGALNYMPNVFLTKDSSTFDLNALAEKAEQLLQNNYEGNLNELFIRGGSSGGARPKVFYKNKGVHWIVKFKATLDLHNIGEIEFLYSNVARNCGIDMPETKLFEGNYFGTQRFDIGENEKHHIHSASGLLYASYRYPSLDYMDLIKATLALTHNMSEALKMFRQMVFNVLTYNKDDHAKKFSFILKNGEWRLTPAYDLVFSEGFNGQHTTTINGNGLPDKEDLFNVAEQTGLPMKKARSIYEEVYEHSRELIAVLKSQKLIK